MNCFTANIAKGQPNVSKNWMIHSSEIFHFTYLSCSSKIDIASAEGNLIFCCTGSTDPYFQ